MKTPKAVQKVIEHEMAESEADLMDQVRAQRKYFKDFKASGVGNLPTDFAVYLAFKLTCPLRDAETIIRWEKDQRDH